MATDTPENVGIKKSAQHLMKKKFSKTQIVDDIYGH